MDGSVFSGLWLEASIVGTLIILNGFFAASEIAMISARRSRIQQLAATGDTRAQRVLGLKEDPDRFLATAQDRELSLAGLKEFRYARSRVLDPRSPCSCR